MSKETLVLAEFVAGVRPAHVPADVAEVLQRALVDAVGCALHGSALPWSRLVAEHVLAEDAGRDAVLWASGGRPCSALGAALAHGAAVHGFDFDDHHRAKIHPGAAVIPAALALGQRLHSSGEQLLAAIATGYETMIRVSLAANPGPARMRGWHLTGTCGTFGAAAAASVLLGLDAPTTASALGLAGTQSAGLWAFTADGAMSKRLHPGRAAQGGLMAALLAQRGFQGPTQILEAEDGGWLAAMSDQPRPERIHDGLGQAWRTLGTCFKPHACCGSNHACVDGAIDIMQREDLSPDDIASVQVGIGQVVMQQTGFAYHPGSVLNAQMSIRYNVAVALMDRRAYLEQFTPQRIADPALTRLAERIEVVIDAEMDAVYPERYAGKIEIVCHDGRRYAERVDFSRGMPERPMDRAWIEDKFRSLAGSVIGGPASESVLAALRMAYELPDCAVLSERLGSLRMEATPAA